MRVIEGENELRLTCSRSASGGIALLRCETQDDIVRLPDEIDGPSPRSARMYSASGPPI